MISQLLVLTGVFSRLAAADNLSLWLGTACTGADEGYTDLSRSGPAADARTTAIMNFGPQDSKRWIRGANALAEPAAGASVDGSSAQPSKRAVVSRNGVTIHKRVEGDTYQCPNVPSGAAYFFVVQSSSATDTETFGGDEDTQIRNDFDAAFNAEYQNPSGQTSVSSYTPLGGDIDDVQVTLTMQQGVIQDIPVQDIDSLMSSLNDFRGAQSSPINFLVSLYTGVIGHPDAGLIAAWNWNGD
ncbi:hypothetical protein K438DRAFT_1962387 [Mycena galopus ATCC 62051]|nr:hypothetical protein K438DRAFT_1962387 [Mycena galopus ATCC 62051]